eukprot:380458-Hanusia_phi.AAC.1
MEVVTYSGPDTFGHEVFLPSVSRKAAKVRKTSSVWIMRVAASDPQISGLPSINALNFIGQTDVPIINMNSNEVFRYYMPSMPLEKYTAAFYGSLKVRQEGQYEFCITSDDGSKLWIEGRM